MDQNVFDVQLINDSNGRGVMLLQEDLNSLYVSGLTSGNPSIINKRLCESDGVVLVLAQ